MNDLILILNYSDEFSLEIARRLRMEQVLGRIVSGMTTAAQVREMKPRGIILSGEAANAAGVFDAGILDLDVPVLALGHASHMMLAAQGGASAAVAIAEQKAAVTYGDCPLFADVSGGERYIKEAMTLMLPADMQGIASAAGCTVAFAHEEKKQYGIQFELERNDPEGTAILHNFAREICGCTQWWTQEACYNHCLQGLKDAAQRFDYALCAVSGGVDSTVAAVLAHQAFGERMTAVFLDDGLRREGEAQDVIALFEQLRIPLVYLDRAQETMLGLAGKESMEEKRDVVLNILRDEMLEQVHAHAGNVTLVLGTNYSDIWSGGFRDLWAKTDVRIQAPLVSLFKTEVRDMAVRLGLGEEMAQRKPFPALGLAARIIGEVTPQRLESMRIAERIFREEIAAAGLERKLHKYFPVLVKPGSVPGREMLILRAVMLSGGMLNPARLPYDMVERCVARILEAAPLCDRVFYDQTPTKVGNEAFS